jgi:hypothetical protein
MLQELLMHVDAAGGGAAVSEPAKQRIGWRCLSLDFLGPGSADKRLGIFEKGDPLQGAELAGGEEVVERAGGRRENDAGGGG